MHRDPGAQIIGIYPHPRFPDIGDDPTPVSSLRVDVAPGLLAAEQRAQPGSLTLMAAGVQATAWTNLVGPVFVDPQTLVISDLRPASTTGPTLRSYTLPPGVPRGTTLLFQAFELLSTGRLLTSNATVAGIW